MPGPLSNPNEKTFKRGKHVPGSPNGKTKRDKESGKHSRRLLNRKSDTIRNNGGKQFASKNKQQ
jgi:hypothetical protein